MQATKQALSAVAFGIGLAMMASASGQTSATGQVRAPKNGHLNTGATTTNCSGLDATGMPVANATGTDGTTNTNCVGTGPGFVEPSTNRPQGDQHVVALVRVAAVVAKPAGDWPPAENLEVVAGSTMVKAKLPKLGACLSAGKGWSGKTGAATSTTCLDRRGEVVAYQECQPAAGVSPMTCKVVTPGDPGGSQENASNQ